MGHGEPSICLTSPSTTVPFTGTTTQQQCQAVGTTAAAGIRTLAGVRGNCHITVTLTKEDKFTFSLLLQQSFCAGSPDSPVTKSHLKNLLLRRWVRAAWHTVLCLKYIFNGRDFKMQEKSPFSCSLFLSPHPQGTHKLEGQTQLPKVTL